MTFAAAIASGLRGSFNFKSTARRTEYWYFALFVFLVQLVLGVFDALIGTAIGARFDWLANGASLLLLLPQLSISARRYHDAGFSGKWLLLYLAPVAALIFALPTVFKFLALDLQTPSEAQIIEFFSAVAPFFFVTMLVGIFNLTITLLPSKPYAAGNPHVAPQPGDPKLDELKEQGW